uniref:Uncharacterized protein n=1 Tax=Aegilops tauschii subsp. strangulata TaxID=200361 RepID=A0A453P4K4_AEGTS
MRCSGAPRRRQPLVPPPADLLRTPPVLSSRDLLSLTSTGRAAGARCTIRPQILTASPLFSCPPPDRAPPPQKTVRSGGRHRPRAGPASASSA